MSTRRDAARDDSGATRPMRSTRCAAWVEANVPRAWVDAGRAGGAAAVREVRTRAEYEAWYPVFAASGLVVPTWPVEYGGLDLSPRGRAARSSTELRAVQPRPAQPARA